MKKLILAAFAMFTLSACSTAKWDSMMNLGDENALKDYTALIAKHSTERSGKVSKQIVEHCNIKPEGMSVAELADFVKENHEKAEKCWNDLLEYPKTDVRFFKEGKIEKEVLAEFNEKKDKIAELFAK